MGVGSFEMGLGQTHKGEFKMKSMGVESFKTREGQIHKRGGEINIHNFFKRMVSANWNQNDA
jgi:hypothetical protein